MKTKKMNKEKLNLTIAPEVKKYLQEESEVFGMSISAFITMVVQQYRTQATAITEMSKFQEYINQLKNFEKEDK